MAYLVSANSASRALAIANNIEPGAVISLLNDIPEKINDQFDSEGICSHDAILRQLGFRCDGDIVCDSCGLASMDESFPVCEDCGHCAECGCRCKENS
jgi:hypothetical protein